jgi:hypothetical protein
MNRKVINFLSWLLIPTGIILVCISTIWFSNYKYSLWESLVSPQIRAAKITDADRLNVWVETKDKQLFKANIGCYKNNVCREWVEVKDVAGIKIDDFTVVKRGNNCEILDEDKGEYPGNPKGTVIECVLVIDLAGPEYPFKTYYALMSDGTVKYWRNFGNDNWEIYFFVISSIVFSSITIFSFSKIRKIMFINKKAG